MKAGFRAGIYATAPPPIFDLRDIHVEHLNLTVHLRAVRGRRTAIVGYGARRRGIEGVDVDADADPRSATNDVVPAHGRDRSAGREVLRAARAHGRARARSASSTRARATRSGCRRAALGERVGEGPQGEYELELSDDQRSTGSRSCRPSGRKRDYVANTLELDAVRAHAAVRDRPSADRSPRTAPTSALTGELLDYWDRPYDGAWNLELAVKNLGPTLRTCIKSTIGGDNLGGTIALRGPFVAPPRVELEPPRTSTSTCRCRRTRSRCG